jgi:hypothetical protein
MIRIRPAACLSLQARVARSRLTPWAGISFFTAGNEMERVKGIEPSYSAWKAAALPLSYTRAWAIT